MPSRATTGTGGGTGRLGRLARGTLLALALTCFTALVFAVTLAVTSPASFLASLWSLPPQVEMLSGSLWRGRATLAGGYRLDWQASARDLWRLRLVADARLEGADTQLAGELAASPLRVTATGWTGRAGPGMLALAPGLLIESCSTQAVVDIDRFAVTRGRAAASGLIEIEAGRCIDAGGTGHPVPAIDLVLSTEGRDAVAVLDAGSVRLARVALTGDGTLSIRIEPDAAALVPGLPSSAPIMLDYPLR